MKQSKRQINISVDEVVYKNLTKIAGEKSLTPTAYATMLFEAAYAARCGFADGDGDLKTAVERTVILRDITNSIETVARCVGLSERTVERILLAWENELRGLS